MWLFLSVVSRGVVWYRAYMVGKSDKKQREVVSEAKSTEFLWHESHVISWFIWLKEKTEVHKFGSRGTDQIVNNDWIEVKLMILKIY